MLPMLPSALTRHQGENTKMFALYVRILIYRPGKKNKPTTAHTTSDQIFRGFEIHIKIHKTFFSCCVSCYFGSVSTLKFFNKDSEIKNARTTPRKTVKLLSPVLCFKVLCVFFSRFFFFVYIN